MLKRNDPKVVCHSRLARESRGNENQYLDSRLHGNDRGDTGNLRGEIYDRILADVPCSNTGVIRRKPDIRWRFSLKGLGLLVKTQKKMLDRLVPLLKTGGTLVYSTCSLEPEENQLLVESWLKANPSFRLVAERKYFPPVSGTDGGYAAVILKK
jgi:16S rRNA (cytosine967-C5)-methyltransferase